MSQELILPESSEEKEASPEPKLTRCRLPRQLHKAEVRLEAASAFQHRRIALFNFSCGTAALIAAVFSS